MSEAFDQEREPLTKTIRDLLALREGRSRFKSGEFDVGADRDHRSG